MPFAIKSGRGGRCPSSAGSRTGNALGQRAAESPRDERTNLPPRFSQVRDPRFCPGGLCSSSLPRKSRTSALSQLLCLIERLEASNLLVIDDGANHARAEPPG